MRTLLDRLTGRTAAVVAAVVLAAVATFLLRDYVRSAEQEATANADLVSVIVARGSIDAGVEASLILSQQFAVQRDFPRDLVPEGALTRLDEIQGFVVRRIEANQVMTASMFAAERPPTAAFEVPAGQVAVSVDVEVTAAVANFLDPDDRVNLLVHLAGGGDAPADGAPAASGPITRHLLQDVRILAIGRRVTAGADPTRPDAVSRDDQLLTLTLAVDSVDAERLVFAQFEGTLWITLLPERVDDYQPTTSTGRSRGNLFQ